MINVKRMTTMRMQRMASRTCSDRSGGGLRLRINFIEAPCCKPGAGQEGAAESIGCQREALIVPFARWNWRIRNDLQVWRY